MEKLISISRRDIFWNYLASFFKIASSAILLPFILRELPSETIGIWTVFITITTFSGLLDFGFNPTFTRNITYVFSGVRKLKTEGFEPVDKSTSAVDFSLLKGVISSMKTIYARMGLMLMLFLSTVGTYYISVLLKEYKGNTGEVYFSWAILIMLNCYNIYTSFYESLLLGRGLIRRSKQIIILSNGAYIILAIILILLGFGLVAIVSAQALAVLINRILSYKVFFNRETRMRLSEITEMPKSDILKAVYPNALKIGLTSIGGFLIQKSSFIIGSLYLSLEDIASYGISIQIIAVLSTMAGIYTNTYQPRITQLQVTSQQDKIRDLYLNGQVIMLITYVTGGLAILFIAPPFLSLVGSNTNLLTFPLLLFALALNLEQTNMIIAGSILLTKNEVPFFKASIFSGLAIIAGLLLSFRIFNYGLLNLILIPFVIDIVYQAWKWPYEVIKELKISTRDVFVTMRSLFYRFLSFKIVTG